MPFQVRMFEYVRGQSGGGRAVEFRNVPDDLLQSRIVERWDRGEAITWNGRTADSTRASITVIRTDDAVDATSEWGAIVDRGEEATNDVITGPAGAGAGSATIAAGEDETESPLRDHRRVMVVHGRNLPARDATFQFLRALGLSP